MPLEAAASASFGIVLGVALSQGRHVPVGSHLTVMSLRGHLRGQSRTQIPLGRGGRPEEIVGAALYLAGDASSFTTGSAIVIDGGLTSSR